MREGDVIGGRDTKIQRMGEGAGRERRQETI